LIRTVAAQGSCEASLSRYARRYCWSSSPDREHRYWERRRSKERRRFRTDMEGARYLYRNYAELRELRWNYGNSCFNSDRADLSTRRDEGAGRNRFTHPKSGACRARSRLPVGGHRQLAI